MSEDASTLVTENLVPSQSPCWPKGSKPVDPVEFATPAAGTINRGWLWMPHVLEGYTPKLFRWSVNARRATTGLYDVAVAPEWWVGFIDPANPDWPRRAGKFTPAAALRQPRDADIMRFEAAATFAIIRSSNDGQGWIWPANDPETYWPLLMMAHRISNLAEATFTPVIRYVKDEAL